MEFSYVTLILQGFVVKFIVQWYDGFSVSLWLMCGKVLTDI